MIKRIQEFWRAVKRGDYGTDPKAARQAAYKRGHGMGYDFMEKHLGAKEDDDGLDR